MEIGGTTILGNTHTYIHIYIYMYVYMPFTSRNTSHVSYSNHLQYCLPSTGLRFYQLLPSWYRPTSPWKKRSGLWSVEGVGLVGVELKTHVCRYLSKKKWKQIAGYWLVVEPTHLENMGPSKWLHLPQVSGWKFQKCGRNHQPGRSPMLWASKLRRISWAANKINGGGGS